MEIRIMSRERLEMISHFPFPPETAVISITDHDAPPVQLKNRPQYLLRVSFDDVDLNCLNIDAGRQNTSEEALIAIYHLCTEAHAGKIAKFYHSIRESVGLLICQCEFGQSRSAAIAAAIAEFRMRKGIDIFADQRYFPNKRAYHLTIAALRKTADPPSPGL